MGQVPSLVVGLQVVDAEPTIEGTAPAPVDVKQAVVVVAIADERMALAPSIGACIQDGDTHVQGIAHHGYPFIIGIIIPKQIVRSTIAEIGTHRRRDALVQCTARHSTIIHVNAHPAMINKDGNIFIVSI